MVEAVKVKNGEVIVEMLAEISRFQEVMRELRNWGASDTEPDAELHWRCYATWIGNDSSVMERRASKNPWQLFESVSGWRAAQAKLDKQWTRVKRAIKKANSKAGWRDTGIALRDECWRASWQFSNHI